MDRAMAQVRVRVTGPEKATGPCPDQERDPESDSVSAREWARATEQARVLARGQGRESALGP